MQNNENFATIRKTVYLLELDCYTRSDYRLDDDIRDREHATIAEWLSERACLYAGRPE